MRVRRTYGFKHRLQARLQARSQARAPPSPPSAMATSACHASDARSSTSPSTSAAVSSRPSASPTAREVALVQKMTVREKVGQLFMPTIPGQHARGRRGPGQALPPRRRHLLPGQPAHATADRGAVQRPAEGRDEERRRAAGHQHRRGAGPGLAPAVHHAFPGQQAARLDRHPDEDTRLAAEVTGEELRAVGINQDNAPDADVNVNPNNPVIGVRSFGADPKKVAHLVGVAIDAYRATGVAVVAKHFPGHGDTATDSHTGLPIITTPRRSGSASTRRRSRPPIEHHADVDHDRAHRRPWPGQVPASRPRCPRRC